MEEYTKVMQEAIIAFKTADHLMYVSYPLLKDNKLLLALVYNLHISGFKAVYAFLLYEKLYKRLHLLPSDFQSRIDLFESHLMGKIDIRPEVCKIIKNLKSLVDQHQRSPIEFSRKDAYVLCNEDYSRLTKLTPELLRTYLSSVREFLSLLSLYMREKHV